MKKIFKGVDADANKVSVVGAQRRTERYAEQVSIGDVGTITLAVAFVNECTKTVPKLILMTFQTIYRS